MYQFHEGQKVVCIAVIESTCKVVRKAAPVIGEIYTIDRLLPGRYLIDDGDDRDTMGCYLKEIDPPVCTCAADWNDRADLVAWPVDAFRPLVETKKQTDISVFTKILDDAKIKQPEQV